MGKKEKGFVEGFVMHASTVVAESLIHYSV
jgi:hypothetical protein